MLSSIHDKKFEQIQDDLKVQTFASIKYVQILKLLFPQAVTASRVPADGCELTCYLRNVVSVNCIYGFASLQSRERVLFYSYIYGSASLQSREIVLFYSFLSLSGGADS